MQDAEQCEGVQQSTKNCLDPIGNATICQNPAHVHYYKDVSHLRTIDVYRVLVLFGVTDPCLAHAIKKLLVAGGRGAGKDKAKDVAEARDSLSRWQEMHEEDAACLKTS